MNGSVAIEVGIGEAPVLADIYRSGAAMVAVGNIGRIDFLKTVGYLLVIFLASSTTQS